ncbi:MAG: hypothetical protein IPM16_14085 [Chloroflexi bacterium]|nr:hypothetical protein [Chloroflexota bacterium]
MTGVGRPVIASLVGKALLWRDAQTGRLSIHELLRQYAEEALESSGQAASVRDAHRIHFAAYTDKWSLALRDDQLNALNHLDQEYDNIVRAFEAATDIATPEAILPFTGFCKYFAIRSRLHDGARLLDAVITAMDGRDSIALGRLLYGRAALAYYLYDSDTHRVHATRAIAVLRAIDETCELPAALAEFGKTMRGNAAGQLEVTLEAVRIAESCGDIFEVAYSSQIVGFRLRDLNRIDEAREWTAQSHRLAQQLRNPWLQCHAAYALSHQALAEANLVAARRFFEETVGLATHIGFRHFVFWSLYRLYEMSLRSNDGASAKRYALDFLKNARSVGAPDLVCACLLAVADACGELGAFEEAAEYMREAANARYDSTLSMVTRLQSGGVLIALAGFAREATGILSVVRNQPEYAQLTALDHSRVSAGLETCRNQLGDARYEEIATAASKKSLEQLHAELYAILNSPPFVQ